MQDDVAIKVHNLHKSFELADHKQDSIKHILVNPGKTSKKHRQKVLNGVDFEIKKGEFFGIVGRNGSGKSTLLKLLAGVYTPDSGAVEVKGNLTPFIELGVGFNPELSGRDNVYLSASLLGFTRKQVDEMYNDIVSFAELEEHMDKKLKNYSSGMQVRLAFSIAVKAKNDILIFDEVLAVGDEAFQKKCSDFFTEIKKDSNKTIILVTHNMEAVKKYCNRAVLFNNGEICLMGSPEIVAEAYKELNYKAADNYDDTKLVAYEKVIEHGAKLLTIKDGDGKKVEKTLSYKSKELIDINIVIQFKKKLDNLAIDIGIRNGLEGQYFMYHNTEFTGALKFSEGELATINLKMQNILGEGEYALVASIYEIATHRVYFLNRQLARIKTGPTQHGGLIAPDYNIEISKEKYD